jgi:quercetin dioxygenase-like cupin family protein
MKLCLTSKYRDLEKPAMKEIEVVRTSVLRKSQATTGILRDVAFESATVLFARSRVPGGTESGWHHHGKRDVYGFVVAGRLRFDYSTDEKKSIAVAAGDSFHIPVGLIHRDVNPDPDQDAQVVNLMIGEGPPVVNVPNP